MNAKCCRIRIVVYLLAFGTLACRKTLKKSLCEDIGLYPSSNLLELQTHSKGLFVKFSIEVSKVITIDLLYP